MKRLFMKRFTVALLAVLVMGAGASASLLGVYEGEVDRARGWSIDACFYDAESSFTAGMLGAVFADSALTRDMKMAIYADNANAPGTLLGFTDVIEMGPGRFEVALNTPVAITEGDRYWIASWVGTGTGGAVAPMRAINNNDAAFPRYRVPGTAAGTDISAPFPDGSAFGPDSATTYAMYAIAATPAATNPTPANNAVGVEINPVLSWDAPNPALLIDPDGAFEYIVYFDSNESLVEGGDATVGFGPLDETEWSPPYLSTTTTYYWRVDVVDPNVGGTPVVYPGQVWSFTTGTSVCEYEPLGDLNGNCIVDLADLAILVSNWLVCNLVNGDCP